MIHNIDNHQINPNESFKNQLDYFNDYYKTFTGVPYQYTPKDFKNFKLLLAKLRETQQTLESFLDNLKNASDWYIDNLSIPLLNSHFNQLAKPQKKTSKFPDHYDKKFYNTLDTQLLQDYQKHLRGLGYQSVYNSGGSTWAKNTNPGKY